MEKRKEKILNIIIREHIKTAAPVGSSVLANKYKLNVSSATIRNEMASLEEEGYITQPHTSAGRIPTEKAYNFYIENLVTESGEKKITQEEKNSYLEILNDATDETFKKAAKVLAQNTNAAVFWAFQKNNLYYTGISNLLSQPEFMQHNLIYDISAIIDRMDDIIADNFDSIDYGSCIFIGSNNPFSEYCSTVLAKYRIGNKIGLFGVLAPMRMDYERNMELINFINNKIKNN